MDEIAGYRIHPVANTFPLMSGHELDKFIEDVAKYGQREPIILIKMEDGSSQVLDGRNRLAACARLGIKPEFDWYAGADPVGYVLSLNLYRRHLNESQRAMVAARLVPIYEEEAKERMLAGKVPEGDPGTVPSEGTEQVVARRGRARELAADALNVGTTSVAKALKTLKGAVPELVEMVEKGQIRVELAEQLSKRIPGEQREVSASIKAGLEEKPDGNAKAIVRSFDKDKVIESIRNEPQPLPEGPFRVIVADYPWSYEKRQEDGTQRGQTPYPTMTIEEGIAMGQRVQRVAHDDAILWFWTTNAHMPVANEIVKAWGFTHKTILSWDKERMGTGDWLRGQSEHCIMAVRGNPVVDLTNQTTILRAPRSDKHSEKPGPFYDLVEELCPGSKLEMFARKSRGPNWTTWGAEAPGAGAEAVDCPPPLTVEPDDTESADIIPY